ncbi:MAG: FAD-dependent oxidoreductase [Coriobacteriia bacterium]|nr:FAD-dependent oxidoreductase [Coriobacteriia bacterium]MCL2537086.1 FAD-dependent oxidoreductase [Coriobacteriia bacterium]
MTEAATKTIDLAIIGGGPAGLTAGLYGSRGMVSTVVFERQQTGGQIATTEWVENYPAFPEGISGSKLSGLMTAQTEMYGASIELFVTVTSLTRLDCGSFELQTDAGDTWHARAVIVAAGAVPSKLGIPGEEEYTGRGVSWCATCDAGFFKERTVVAIGGGDSALEEALFLTKFASKVYLVHRRDEFRATPIAVERVKQNEKIELVLSAIPLEIVGDGDKVTGLVVQNVKDDSCQTLEVDGVFEFVGVNPVNELLAELVDTSATRGHIPVDKECKVAGIPGLFAAGDLTDSSLKQVISAAGSGATAAFAALKYLDDLPDLCD